MTIYCDYSRPVTTTSDCPMLPMIRTDERVVRSCRIALRAQGSQHCPLVPCQKAATESNMAFGIWSTVKVSFASL